MLSHVLSAAPVFAALSKFKAAVGSVEKSAVDEAGVAPSASAVAGRSPISITKVSRVPHSHLSFFFGFIIKSSFFLSGIFPGK